MQELIVWLLFQVYIFVKLIQIYKNGLTYGGINL